MKLDKNEVKNLLSNKYKSHLIEKLDDFLYTINEENVSEDLAKGFGDVYFNEEDDRYYFVKNIKGEGLPSMDVFEKLELGFHKSHTFKPDYFTSSLMQIVQEDLIPGLAKETQFTIQEKYPITEKMAILGRSGGYWGFDTVDLLDNILTDVRKDTQGIEKLCDQLIENDLFIDMYKSKIENLNEEEINNSLEGEDEDYYNPEYFDTLNFYTLLAEFTSALSDNSNVSQYGEGDLLITLNELGDNALKIIPETYNGIIEEIEKTVNSADDTYWYDTLKDLLEHNVISPFSESKEVKLIKSVLQEDKEGAQLRYKDQLNVTHNSFTNKFDIPMAKIHPELELNPNQIKDIYNQLDIVEEEEKIAHPHEMNIAYAFICNDTGIERGIYLPYVLTDIVNDGEFDYIVDLDTFDFYVVKNENTKLVYDFV